jgi:hypothetical protein
MKNERREFHARIRRERQALGTHGAASEVRRVDPASYQPQEAPRAVTERPPVAAQIKRVELCDAADKLLIADAKRRLGKRVRKMIVAGRYQR